MSRILTCMIIDDERKSIEVLKHYVGLMPQLKLQGTETDPSLAQEKLLHEKVDFMLLDGEMPGMNGVQLVQSLPDPPKVILCTGHERFATQGFDIRAVDFLLKPISFERFTKAIHYVFKALNVKHEQSKKRILGDYFFVPEAKSPYKVRLNVDDIQCVEARRNYVIVYTFDGEVMTRFSLTQMLDRLHEDDFIQVHKGFIVARNLIHKYNSTEIYLTGLNKAIPISSTYAKDVHAKLKRGKIR